MVDQLTRDINPMSTPPERLPLERGQACLHHGSRFPQGHHLVRELVHQSLVSVVGGIKATPVAGTYPYTIRLIPLV